MNNGADVNAVEEDYQRTPLHYACKKGHNEVALALVINGANVNAVDIEQSTPLHYACEKGNIKLAMTLMAKGANVNARNIDQRTPLDNLDNQNRDKLESIMIKEKVGDVM